MKNIQYKSLILGCLILFSCQQEGQKAELTTVEIWKSDLIVMKTPGNEFTDSFTDHDQYLYLYDNGKARLVDSLKNGTVSVSESAWEIKEFKGKTVFSFGHGREDEGIMGIIYPIVIKNEVDFKMLFDSTSLKGQNKHVWDLKRHR
ncbi:MAG: hypothetical protein HEP71_11045 [Roseivirga sp.]|nr:hypothetical protein [Roseivirga sp.]